MSEALNPPYITLGSLFDGIGAIPYAASFFGIKTLWASEILPNAISVTKRHFPDMEHLGDITKVDGGRIHPVNIIGFGSPCQSWSVAGNRTGLSGKSGLFMEAIRIIKEMRAATNGQSPEIVFFENVVGLLSGKSYGGYAGSDYKAVLEAFTKIENQAEIPMPESGRWANAGMVRGRGVDLAWVVKDSSKHFRVPQRRKRLYLVVDFAGQRASQILFVTKSLSGYLAARDSQREGTAASLESRAESAGESIETISMFMAGQANNARSIAYSESVSPTLKGSPSGLNQVPCVCEQASADLTPPTAYGICAYHCNSMLSANPSSGFYAAETSRTLDQSCCNPACQQGGLAIVEPRIARTLTARADSSPCVDRGQNIVIAAEPLTACHEKPKTLTPWDRQGMRVYDSNGVSPVLAGADRCSCFSPSAKTPCGCRFLSDSGGRNPAGLVMTPDILGKEPQCYYPLITGTLCASAAGLSRPGGMASETDLCVSYCLQGNLIGRKDENGPKGSGINKEVCFTVSAADRHAIAAVDCRNLYENQELSGTLQAKCTGGYSLNYINPVRVGYIVRRLTPTEAERLMSLPDDWTKYGHDGKLMSDSARYSMCGNSIVVNVLAYIMRNIAELYYER